MHVENEYIQRKLPCDSITDLVNTEYGIITSYAFGRVDMTSVSSKPSDYALAHAIEHKHEIKGPWLYVAFASYIALLGNFWRR